MAKYGRYDPKNKKKDNDKYRGERRTSRGEYKRERIQVTQIAKRTA